MGKDVQITIRPDGKIEFIHDDSLIFLHELGSVNTRRVSHVEPINGTKLWQADLSPVNGPILKGKDDQGFKTHGEAIEAELTWIKENYL